MPLVILSADVRDANSWESGFRSHTKMFEAAGLGTIHYTIGDNGHVVMCTDVDNVDAYMDFIASPETQDAMKGDGVKRETVKVSVLDKELAG